jgi:PAS domain S-box-containing protein
MKSFTRESGPVAQAPRHRPELAEPGRPYRSASDLDPRQLQELLAKAPAVIGLMSGPEHRWTYVNEHLVRVAGRSSAAECLGKTLRESLPEMDSQVFPALLDEVFQTGKPYAGSEVKARLNRAASGQPEEGYFDLVFQPVQSSEGKVEAILIHAVEVTEKVKARKAIEENAERLQLAHSAAQIGTWEWDPLMKTQALSPELHRIFGTEASDPDHAAKWASRVHPADWDEVQQNMQEGHRRGTIEFEYRYLHPDSGLRWLFCKGSRAPQETRMFGIVQDVTARKMGEEASQRLAAIVEFSDDAIISKDLNGTVTSWNPCAQRMFGYTADEIIGRPITTIIPPELHADETRILATIAAGERIEHFETVRLKKNGETIEVSLTVSPVKDQDGKIVGAAKIARDITQRKKAERALQTTERLASVGRLAATVAHEINNPLEAVTNLIYLAKHASSPSDVKKYLSIAEEELERVSHLTKQTLGFYRETKGATYVRMGELVQSLLSVFASRTRNRGIELCTEIDDDPELYAVAGELRQVIANLISNSIDALQAGGKIRVRVSAATRWISGHPRGVRLTVADTGSGIPSELRTQLFEPFFTTKKDVGTGLGLWVCKSITENHHGSIQVRSVATPGKSWTAFSVFLPLNTQESATGELVRKAG